MVILYIIYTFLVFTNKVFALDPSNHVTRGCGVPR